jgi:hypothetical protein
MRGNLENSLETKGGIGMDGTVGKIATVVPDLSVLLDAQRERGVLYYLLIEGRRC